MTRYAGLKSLDAEIHLDLENHKVVMDYTLNHLQSPMDSNNSAKLTSQWWIARKNKKVFLKEYFTQIGLTFLAFLMFIYIPIFTCLSNWGYLKNPNYQYKHQNFLRWFSTRSNGTYELSHTGPCPTDTVTFWVSNNIWIKYQLEKEYQEKLVSVSLVRNFIKFKRFGKYLEVKQSGWLVLFKFSSPPQEGSCIIHHL